MFDPNSRYYHLENNEFNTQDGKVIYYKKRRILPILDEQPIISSISVTQHDRLDRLANQYLQDPLLFWKLLDANNILHPQEIYSKNELNLKKE